MREIPILFSTLMVSAILEDRKTQTRRLKGLEKINSDSRKWVYSHSSLDGHVPHPAIKYNTAPWYLFHPENTNGESWVIQCPFGQIGDVLWVRETVSRNIFNGLPIYKESYQGGIPNIKWRPSIHMKKIHTRIWLEIINVRVERLPEISQEDAKAEGLYNPCPHRPASEGCKHHADKSLMRDCFVCAFKVLWNKINGLKWPWNKNPWIWVIEFRQVEKPII